MSVAASVPSEMAASSAFSYAQAAKGQGTVPSSTTPNSTSQAQDSPAAAPAAKSTASDSEQTVSTAAPEVTDISDARPTILEKQDVDSVQGSEADAKSDSVQERRSDSRRDEEVGKLDRPWRRNDKAPRSSSATTRSGDDHDSRKARRGKKGKASEKQSGDQAASEKEQEAEPEAPKIELSEAPIPTVNPWLQRKEAQAAKTKVPANSTTETVVNGTAGQLEENKPPTKSAEGPTGTRDVPYVNGIKPQRKAADLTRPERNGPRGSRVADKDGKVEIPPSVEDAALWPTPETAIKEEKRKTTDRSDRSDKDSQEDGAGPQAKPRQKEKWVAYEYVPSVSFETQLPQMRNSKPRGGARAAREGGARAPASGIAEKAVSAAPVNKSNGSGERPRETNGAHRATSLPPAAKRASLDNGREQKKVSGQSGSDKGKETTQSVENGQAPRDRPEGRGDRGRGGYRGRGGHHSINTQGQHQHSASGVGAQGFGGAARGHGHYSPPPRQGGHGQMFMPPNQRGRGGRNGANNYHRMSLPNATSRMPAVQTQFTPYDYTMAPMSAVPFQAPPYWDSMLMGMLKSQIEYYFSIENLCKDMYLRARMDSQGFVPLHFIAAFKRMRDLSADMTLIRAVCEDSTEVDFVVGEDDCERLRRREDWQKFVLPMKDRDELARNDGPAQLTYKNRTYAFSQQFNGIPIAYGMPQPGYPTNPNEVPYQPYVDTTNLEIGSDGAINGNGASQLSAEVPDFSPSGSVTFGAEGETLKSGNITVSEAAVAAAELTNGHVEAPLTNGVHVQEQAATQS